MKKLKFIVSALLCALCLSGCGKNSPDDKNIIVAASSVPHAEILNNIKADVEAEGYKLTVREVTDYVTPNMMTDSGDVDANYFQHEPYLLDFNSKNGTDIVSAFKIHFEPMGIYSQKHSDLTKANPRIAIPNDVSNGARARELIKNLTGATIIEAEAQSLPALLQDVDYACINGNYALSAGITNKCIVTEPTDGETAQTNANLIAVKRANLNKPFVEVLRRCLLSEKTKNFIQSRYGSAVKAVF